MEIKYVGNKVILIFTADDEEPECMMCNNVCKEHKDFYGKPYDFCAKHCGPEHGWNGYERTKVEEIKNDR